MLLCILKLFCLTDLLRRVLRKLLPLLQRILIQLLHLLLQLVPGRFI